MADTQNIDQNLLLLLPSLYNKSTFYKSGDILFGKIVEDNVNSKDVYSSDIKVLNKVIPHI